MRQGVYLQIFIINSFFNKQFLYINKLTFEFGVFNVITKISSITFDEVCLIS